MSQIFTQTYGQGQPWLLLHGWGMNHAAWGDLPQRLSAYGQVTVLDLPEHGLSHQVPFGTLDMVLDRLSERVPSHAIIVGWSLGGLLAQALAQRLQQVGQAPKALVLVASTPRFTASADWPHGLPETVLNSFAQDLQRDYTTTIKRFFALQFMGTRNNPAALAALRERILSQPATERALQAGLQVLQQADLRDLRLNVPCLWLLGRLDKLIPVSLAKVLPEFGYPQVEVLPNAAHVPFITESEVFLERVLAFSRGLG